MNRWISPFSTARPTLVMGRFTMSAGSFRSRTCRSVIPAPQGGIDVECIGGHAIGDTTAIVVEKVRGADLEVVVGSMREGAFAVAVPECPDARGALDLQATSGIHKIRYARLEPMPRGRTLAV
jgi:hypothetical protein